MFTFALFWINVASPHHHLTACFFSELDVVCGVIPAVVIVKCPMVETKGAKSIADGHCNLPAFRSNPFWQYGALICIRVVCAKS